MIWARLKRRLRTGWLIAAAGVALTLMLTSVVQSAADARQRERFEREADAARAAVVSRLNTHIALLRATAGLFAGSDTVTGTEFAAFVEALDLATHYPGIQGIGYAAWLEAPDARARAAGMMGAGARFWPEDEGRSAIVFLQPLDRRNRAALGYDMFSEPVRRAAMARARDENAIAATEAVVLVQELDAVRQPGFLIYLPLRRPDGAFEGWVYAPFRAHDFFNQVFADQIALERLTVVVRDEGQAAARLWPPRSPAAGAGRFETVREVELGGRAWRLEITGGGAGGLRPVAGGVLVAGLLLTLALSLAWRWQAVALADAERARARTELLLSEVNHRAANSLQLVASFVYLQAQAVSDPKARAALVQTRARILAVSRVHQRLYTDDAVEGVELRAYIEGLTDGLGDAFEAGGRRLAVSVDSARVSADRAVAVGVALVELVSNAAKYAYPQDAPGEIRVRLEDLGESLRLVVEDDGPGFDLGAKAKGSGLGMKVVRAMAAKLDGELTVERLSPGVRAAVTFPRA